MPVWHERTKALRKDGKLTLVGITQEQHPERCKLFAQWHGIDWPILWDPFNVTGARVVPRLSLVDEHGIVRFTRVSEAALATFLATKYEAPPDDDAAKPDTSASLVEAADAKGPARAALDCLAKLLWKQDATFPDLAPLRAQAAAPHAAPRDHFREGVARLMRYETDTAKYAGDFQGALDAWGRALQAEPGQYIWRRRIQQYGPRMDKPYPFYDWVTRARSAITQRGESPVALRAPLTRSETAGRRGAAPTKTKEPDPNGQVQARADLVHTDVAIARSTNPRGFVHAAQIHLTVRARGGATWDLDADPPVLWIAGRAHAPRPAPDASGAWRFEFGWPDDVTTALHGYVLVSACLPGPAGTCAYVRADLTIPPPGAAK